MNYHIAISIFACIICVLFIAHILFSKSIETSAKSSLASVFFSLFALTLIDIYVHNCASDGTETLLRFVKTLECIIAPCVSVFFWGLFGKSPLRVFAYSVIGINSVLSILSFFVDIYYTVEPGNVDSHGPYFFIYNIVNLCIIGSFFVYIFLNKTMKKDSRLVSGAVIGLLGIIALFFHVLWPDLNLLTPLIVLAYAFGFCFYNALCNILVKSREKEALEAQLAAKISETSRIELLSALERVYISIYEADIEKGKLTTIIQPDFMNSFISNEAPFEEALNAWCSVIVAEQSQADAREFFDPSTIRERMRLVNSISVDLFMSYTGWERETLAVISRDKDGNPVKVLLLCQEINGPKEKELEESESLKAQSKSAISESKFKTEFLSNMSHDIRTPMNAIIGFANIAQKNIEKTEKVSDCIDKILVSGQHLNDLINDILDMSHIESGAISIRETRNRITDLLNSILPIIQSQAAEKKMHLSVDTSGIDSDYVYVDSIKLRRVLVNLLGNSLKFTPEGGMISIEVTQYTTSTPKTAGFMFKIKDNGVGMSQEFINRVYAPYERDDDSSIDVDGGTLGLSITKKIIDLMGGTINVESIVGKGTTFTIDLELRLQEFLIDEVTASTPAFSNEMFKDKRVLVVEDNELNKEIALEILRDAGFQADSASNGLEAIDCLVTSPVNYYDIVLMDISMPVMDGYKATNNLRHMSRKDLATIPIIAMTANAFDEDKLHALASGMNDHVSKPIDIKKLKAAIINQL